MGLLDDILFQFGIGTPDFAKDQQRLAKEVGRAQADRIEQGTRLRGDIEDMIRGMAEGGAPPAFRLGLRPGEGTDIGEFLGQIQSNAELNHLMRLLGIGEGNVSTANQALGVGAGFEAQRQDNLSDLILSILSGIGGGGGGAGGGGRV